MTLTASSINPLPLQLQQVHKAFAGQGVLRGVDLDIQSGDIVGLVGANGAGKTTLIKTALGLSMPDRGVAQVFGEPSLRLSDAVKSRLAFVPQDPNLFGWLSGGDVLAMMAGLYPGWNQMVADELTARWGVPLSSWVSNMSQGERQRLQIVRALATGADLLILDEPVASLDPAGRRQFLSEMVGRCAEQRITVLFSTHIVSDLERCANKVAVLHQGRIVLYAELDVLKEQLFRARIPNALAQAYSQHPSVLLCLRGTPGSTSCVLFGPPAHWADLAARPEMMDQITPLGLEDLLVELGT